MAEKSKWSEVTKNNPCRVCNSDGWCTFLEDGTLCICRRISDGALSSKLDMSGCDYYVHRGPNYKAGSYNQEAPKPSAVGIATADERDRVYRMFLNELPLYDDHQENLSDKRGFIDETIKANLYTSFRNPSVAADKLYANFGSKVFNVPGFVRIESEGNLHRIQMLTRSGMLIPSKNKDGKIVALRLRIDDVEEGEPRYVWFSLKKGIKLTPNIDVNYGSLHDGKTVVITEGELKASRWAQQFPKHTVLGLPGIGFCRRAIEVVQQLSSKPERIILAPDRDIEYKPQVFRPVARLFGELVNMGYNVQFLYWTDPSLKGIDDALQAKSEFEFLNVLQTQEYLEAVGKAMGFADDLIAKGFSECSAVEKFDDEWDEEPSEIDLGSRPLPTIKGDDLPPVFRDYVMDCSERISVAVEYIALSLFAVAVSLIGRKLAVRPKYRDPWSIVPVLWVMLIGRPSMKKSPGLGCATVFLEMLTEQVRELNDKRKSEWAAEVRVLQQERENLLKSLGKRKDKSAEGQGRETSNVDAIKTRITEIELTLRTAKPPEIVYFVSDATKEALMEVIRDNSHGTLIMRDELSAFLKGLGLKGREQDRALYLELYNGKNPSHERRITREAPSLKAAAASILGGIQPGVLAAYIHEASKGEAGADGLMPRFSLVWPDRVHFKYVDRAPNMEAFERINKVMQKLSNFSAEEYGVTDKDKSGLPYIGFSQDAQSLFIAWLTSNEDKAARANNSEVMESFLLKLTNTVCTLALMFHLCDHLDSHKNEELTPISHEALSLAIRWAEVIEAHTRRTFFGCGSPDIGKALILIEKIESGELANGTSVRDIYRKNWTGIKKRDDVIAALEHLKNAGWAKVVSMKSNSNGALSEIVLIHPSVRRAQAGESNVGQ